jgi:hypothetical protein
MIGMNAISMPRRGRMSWRDQVRRVAAAGGEPERDDLHAAERVLHQAPGPEAAHVDGRHDRDGEEGDERPARDDDRHERQRERDERRRVARRGPEAADAPMNAKAPPAPRHRARVAGEPRDENGDEEDAPPITLETTIAAASSGPSRRSSEIISRAAGG